METKYVCKCEKCGCKRADVNVNVVYTSFPPMYEYVCPKCGERGYVRCSEVEVENEQ